MAKSQRNRTARSIYVLPDTWRFWVRMAKARGLSVSAFLRNAVERQIEAEGQVVVREDAA